jgi:hypothetical protein
MVQAWRWRPGSGDARKSTRAARAKDLGDLPGWKHDANGISYQEFFADKRELEYDAEDVSSNGRPVIKGKSSRLVLLIGCVVVLALVKLIYRN